jgi:hypothetical protein
VGPVAVPVPIPASPAAPSPFTLDPNMAPATQSAVLGVLTTESDPAKIQAFAQAIQAQYPIAAGLLMAKANMLRLAHPVAAPAPAPPAPAPAPSPTAPPAVALLPAPPAGLPIGDETTRTGRNANRPSGYPFVHLRGESTYPAKIAQQATGSPANYPQMSRINPQFAKDGVHWINLQTGDALNIPWAWVPKLAPLYRIEVDPGVSPPAQPGAATAMAVRATAHTAGEPGAPMAPAPWPGLPWPPAAAGPLGLDLGIPAEIESAVLGALMTELDSAKLHAFALEIQALWPLAAGLLLGKANALRLPAPPIVVPPPAPVSEEEAREIAQTVLSAASALPAALPQGASTLSQTLPANLGASHAVVASAHP